MEKSSTKNFFSKITKKEGSEDIKLMEKTARKLFTLFSFLFFSSYLFIGMSFYPSFFGLIISKIYILFVFSGAIFSFFLIKNHLKNIIIKIFLWILVLIILIFSLSPFFISL